MKYRTSKIIVSFLTALVLLSMSFLCVSAAETGTCGSNAQWAFDSQTGNLTISGSGYITSYSSADYVPWRSYTDRITSITIEDGITKIGNYAFKDCTLVSDLTLPDGIKEIGYGAFDNCSSLESVSLPASVEKINDAPFYGCTKLSTISVDESNKHYCSDNDGILYNKDKTEIIQYPAGNKSANFSVPYSVTTIGVSAFAGNTSIRNIFMSESVNVIGTTAFYECSSLSSITIPKSVTLIGENAFSKCSKLSEVYFTGTQEQWNTVTLRDNNESLTGANFNYEAKGPETVSEETTSTTAASAEADTPANYEKIVEEQIKNNIELIPAILIGIGVVVLILIIILIRVITKKYPDEK